MGSAVDDQQVRPKSITYKNNYTFDLNDKYKNFRTEST